MYDAQVGRWWSEDPLAEKNYYETPYSYVSNSPLIFLDPNGLTKFKLKIHLKVSTGIIGLGFKFLGENYSFGGIENEIGINLSYDSESSELSLGTSYTNRVIKQGSYYVGGVIGGGESKIKETNSEGFVGVNLKTGKIHADIKGTKDEKFKKKEHGTIGIYTGSEKEGDKYKGEVGVNPEIHLLIVGVGAGINFSFQETIKKEEKNKVIKKKNPSKFPKEETFNQGK